jgi:hypothetical protein
MIIVKGSETDGIIYININAKEDGKGSLRACLFFYQRYSRALNECARGILQLSREGSEAEQLPLPAL